MVVGYVYKVMCRNATVNGPFNDAFLVLSII